MAKRDVILRFAQVENDYNEMKSLLNELNDDLKKGAIDQEYYQGKAQLLEEEIDAIKTQYFMWAEAIFELNKPQRKGKKLSDTEEAWYKTLQGMTRECIKDTSKDALAEIKKIIAEGKNNEE